MVDEISDFEALEIAVREICIEKGLFSAEDHRKFTEFAEHIGPTPAARMVAKAWLDPEYKKLVMTDALASKAVGVDYLNPTGFGTPSDYTDLRVLEDTPTRAPRGGVHPVFLLSAPDPRLPAGVVSHAELSSPPGSLAAPGAGRVRPDAAGRG
jgi:hypothetical protein